MKGLLTRVGTAGNLAVQVGLGAAQVYSEYVQGGKPGMANLLLLAAQAYLHVQALHTEPPVKR